MSEKQKLSQIGEKGLFDLLSESEKYAPVLNTASEKGIDVKLITAAVVKENGIVPVSAGVSLVISAINRAIMEADSEEVTGIIVGSKDIYGFSNSKPTFGVVKKNGVHFSVQSFDPKVSVGPTGIKTAIQFPSLCTMKILHKEFERKDGTAGESDTLISVAKCEPVDFGKFMTNLKEISVTAGMLRPEDAKNYKVVVLRGIVQGIYPMPMFENGKKSGDQQIIEYNELKEPHAVFQINMKPVLPTGSDIPNVVKVKFNQRRYTVSNIFCEDLLELVNIAVEKFPNAPAEQTRWLNDAFCARAPAILVVGTVTRFEPEKKKDAAPKFYVDISAFSIYDYPESEKSTPAAKAKGVDFSKLTKEAPATGEGSVPKVPKVVCQLRDRITDFCEDNGKPVKDISKDEVMNNVLDEGEEIPEGIIEDALRLAKKAAGGA